MQAGLKNKIDELLIYSNYIKSMYTRLAYFENRKSLTEEEMQEKEGILSIIKPATYEENKKVAELGVTLEELENVTNYLIYAHPISRVIDFNYKDNEVERLRIASKISYDLMLRCIHEGFILDDNNYETTFYKAANDNFVYLCNIYHQKTPKSIRKFYTYLKYGKIFVLPNYEQLFFPNLKTISFSPYDRYRALLQDDDLEKYKEYVMKTVDQEFANVIYDGYRYFTEENLEYDEDSAAIIENVLSLLSCIITTLDEPYIDQKIQEFQKVKFNTEGYGRINDMIESGLELSKKLIAFNYNERKKQEV